MALARKWTEPMNRIVDESAASRIAFPFLFVHFTVMIYTIYQAKNGRVIMVANKKTITSIKIKHTPLSCQAPRGKPLTVKQGKSVFLKFSIYDYYSLIKGEDCLKVKIIAPI